MDRATFDTQHESATEKNIAKVMKEADVIITNNGSLEELQKQVDEVMAKGHE